MPLDKIIVATRASNLAYNQSLQVVHLLQNQFPEINFIVKKISTLGDRNPNQPLTEFWGTGIFVKEIEQSLLKKEVDIAVHSLKDMPTKLPKALILASFPPREDARDVLLTSLKNVENNFTIGTSSPRRKLQLSHIYKAARFKDIRGNIETRIKKLESQEYDAIVLAAAGLNRLGLPYDQNQLLSIQECLPAVGQGALAVQCRKNDTRVIQMLKKINHPPTEKALRAERLFLEFVQGGCKFPLAGYAFLEKNFIILDALLGDLKSSKYVRKIKKFPVNFTENDMYMFVKNLLKECKDRGINLN